MRVSAEHRGGLGADHDGDGGGVAEDVLRTGWCRRSLANRAASLAQGNCGALQPLKDVSN